MFAQTREEVRHHFLNVWEKMVKKSPLQPLEQVLAAVIERHPEYHAVLSQGPGALNADFSVDGAEINPFLHMSLHVALVEQLQTDRPPGVVKAYNGLVAKSRSDAHEIEHKMMDCLAASLWQAQRDGVPPDEMAYLTCLNRLV